VFTALLLASCAKPADSGDPLQPPASVILTGVSPQVVLPGTKLVLTGNNLASSASHTLYLGLAGKELSFNVNVLSLEKAEVEVDSEALRKVGEGTFKGEAWIVSKNTFGHTMGHKLPISLTFKEHVTPTLQDVGQGLVYLNSQVKVLGDNFLLGSEGNTVVEVKGCFAPNGSNNSCPGSGLQTAAQVKLTPDKDDDRGRGTFEFSPSIVGLAPGSFTGTVTLINQHADGMETKSQPLSTTFQLDVTRIHRLDQSQVSLGELLDIRGAGFVGGPDKGSTLVSFTGTFTPKDDKPRQVTFDVVPGYRNGGWAQSVLEEGNGIGKTIKVRKERGTLEGTWTPTVYWGGKSQKGLPIKLSINIAPVRQVVWVRFSEEWKDGLRMFGLLAADAQIRKRILGAMKQAYEGINVDFRTDMPEDFKLYVKLDLGGKDPNGLGLLGYDNTPGKDVENLRLYDWLGGVNALTQQDGYPGYGGVFLESILGFSEHPPKGVYKSPLKSPLFDQIFDPFRPDRGGNEVTTAEALAAGDPDSTKGCPTQDDDRVKKARCAIRVLGNIVGSTSAHELGHSLGLADPYGPPTAFHNPGDEPNRLMEGGQGRPFEERAELNGKGPAVFCDEEFLYLRNILPLDPPKDPGVTRPGCY
jgi:hypothetical protein